MRIFQTILSIIALCTVAVSGGQAADVLHWNAAVVDLVTAGGSLLGTFGVTPLRLPPMAARACAGVATLLSATVAAHASGSIPGGPKLFNFIAMLAALVAIVGRWQPASVAPAGDAGKAAPAIPADPPAEPPKAA